MRFEDSSAVAVKATPAPLQIKVAGKVASTQEEINQALIVAISGLIKLRGCVGYGLTAASPAGGWHHIEIQPAPADPVVEEPSAA